MCPQRRRGFKSLQLIDTDASLNKYILRKGLYLHLYQEEKDKEEAINRPDKRQHCLWRHIHVVLLVVVVKAEWSSFWEKAAHSVDHMTIVVFVFLLFVILVISPFWF